MENSSADIEQEMRTLLLKTLRTLIYNTLSEQHFLSLYAQLVYRPLASEKKQLIATAVPAKKQTEAEIEVFFTNYRYSE